MRRLFLIRHCESEANAAGILDGYPDAVLTAHGEDQARRLAARASRWGLASPHIVSSPMRRALGTAAPLAAALRIGVQEDMRLCAGEGRAAERTFAEAGAEVAAAVGEAWQEQHRELIVVTHRFPLRGYLDVTFGAEDSHRVMMDFGNGDVLEIDVETAPLRPWRHHRLAQL